jgi:hypothetical protein
MSRRSRRERRAPAEGTRTRSRPARLAGLEPATTGLEGRCSIQLSYRRGLVPTTTYATPTRSRHSVTSRSARMSWPMHPGRDAGKD